MKDIKTVQDLIDELKEYPADMPVTYDYSLPVVLTEIGEENNRKLTIA